MPPTSGLLPIREYILVALTATAVTYLLTGLVRRLAIRVGAIANPRARDVHVAPIPRMGGIGIFLGVAGAMGLAHQLPALSHGFDASFDSVAVYLDGGSSGEPVASSIVDLTGTEPVVLREGAVTKDAIAEVLGVPAESLA